MADWQDISSAPLQNGFCAIVDDGVRIGEAECQSTYVWNDDDDDPREVMRWRWANHGSCGCCWDEMEMQPLRWMPLPEREAANG